MPAARGIFLAPFDELYEPALLAELAAKAEARGWDGFFLWDHVAYRAPVRAVADPWIALSAVAIATSRVRLGPMVTPLSRRRMSKLARETITLDHLSEGRLTLGVGLGSDRTGELERFSEVTDARERASILDRSLAELDELWAGGFEPRSIQQPRIPVWIAARWPHRRPLRRAVRWDGMFPIELPGPEELATLAGEIAQVREPGSFDLVAEVAPGAELEAWEQAGASWIVTGFGPQPRAAEVLAAIEAGPR